jgi:hypothetical protein
MANPRPISGNQGYAKIGGSGIAEITDWTATLDYGVKTYVGQHNVVGGIGYQATVQGNTKCSGSCNGLFDPNYAPGVTLGKGALVQLQLFLNFPTSFVSFLGRIATRTIGANINTGDPVPFSATFESDGVVTETIT